ncbi:MAG: sigma-70 family RNA polymerase sigma factor [Chloroflexi bacterium]|nr:MAG: sigma-70 family RNA polymerase sigma factor [Chloroflexota bacterium]
MTGDEQGWLGERFEENRSRLTAIAYRMLGSGSEADDAVQEAWLRLSRSDVDAIDNLAGWLTTVVGRVCLDMLRSRKSRREEPLDSGVYEAAENPEQEAVLADSIGLAMLVVLESLTPAERVAFVLHDMFAMPFEEIAPIVGRSEVATRQLASRARRRVQGAEPAGGTSVGSRREIVDAFLAASRGGDFTALLALLDPDVVLIADDATVRTGGIDKEVVGAERVAAQFAGRARAAQAALIDGEPGLVWAPGGKARVVFAFTFREGRITGIDIVGDADRLRELDVVIL